jgi:hypothetical protein
VRESLRQKSHGEQRKERQCREATVLVRLDRLAATDGGKRRDAHECDGHAKEQRQSRSQERLIGAGENEGQHGQDTRAEDRKHARQIGQNQKSHLVFLSMRSNRRLASGMNFRATPFMQ